MLQFEIFRIQIKGMDSRYLSFPINYFRTLLSKMICLNIYVNFICKKTNNQNIESHHIREIPVNLPYSFSDCKYTGKIRRNPSQSRHGGWVSRYLDIYQCVSDTPFDPDIHVTL